MGSRVLCLCLVAACAADDAPPESDTGGSTSGIAETSGSSTTGTPATTTAEPAESSETTAPPPATSTGPTEPPLDVFFPRTSLQPEMLGVVVNDNDPLSVEVAAYYVEARGIPEDNVVHLSFDTASVLPEADFTPLKAELDAALPDAVQGLALTWTTPYRVDCMSVTAAFALGFDTMYCNTSGQACGETAPVDYYDADTLDPWVDLGIRPAMMLAATSIENATALIDRGVASDGTHPTGDGYFVRTTDSARSVRYPDFQTTVQTWEDVLDLTYIDNGDGSGSDVVEDTVDVFYYFTGLADVPGIDTNTYRPGAVADHLTSFGGFVPDSSQMSALRWLEAGATASFGTVVEPCAVLAKFPNTKILLPHYFRGETVLEAYWKSVWWPGEGLFIGEPLARPWDGSSWDWQDGTLTITTNLLIPGVDYDVQWADAEDGPWTTLLTGSIPQTQTFDLVVEDAYARYYRLTPAS